MVAVVENNSIMVAVMVVLVEYNRIVVAMVVQYNRIVVVVMVVEYLEGVIFLQLDQNQIVYTLYCFKNRNYFEFH